MSKKSTIEKFIEQAKEIHTGKYDYSKVEYVNNKTKVVITCPLHGDFEQKPNNHLSGQGCMRCKADKLALKLNRTLDEFIKQANEVHGSKYNYSKTCYTKSIDKIIIVCSTHGDFEQEANSHLQGHGCPQCGLEQNTKLSKELRLLVRRTKGVIQQAFIRKKFSKETRTYELLGCTWEEFKAHLENNPYNFTIYQEDLDLDHIIPTSSAKTEVDIIKLHHYTNFQLLPSKYNRNVKRDKPFNKEGFEKWLKQLN